MADDVYQPCPCGSGKKYKFCCKGKFQAGGSGPENLALFPLERIVVNPDWREQGLAMVVVIRRMPGAEFMVASYLTDIFCLGLKDTSLETGLGHEELRLFLSAFQGHPVEIPYEDARSLVLGAVEYAHKLGFEPHPDWARTRTAVEDGRPFQRKFDFGRDGKPFYIQGSEDNHREIMAKLDPLFKKGEAFFVNPLEEPDEDEFFDDRYDEIVGYLEAHDFKAAHETIDGFMADYPDSPEASYLRGTCLAMMGKTEESVPFLEKSIAMEPTPQAYFNLAGAYKSLLCLKEYASCLELAVELDGEKGEYGRRARAELDGFAKHIQKTTGLTYEKYFLNMGRFERAFEHLTEGRYEEARDGFQEVLALEPDHIQSHGNLGLAYAGLGDREKALAHLDRAIALDPDYEPAIQNRCTFSSLKPGERFDVAGNIEVEFYSQKMRDRNPSPRGNFTDRRRNRR